MVLSPNKRIFFNILATFGRSVLVLACGLVTGRWSLLVLGKENLGLFGVIGGTTLFIGFINSILSTAVSRFYAYSLGEAQHLPGNGLENCRRWFNTATLVHSVIPVCLILVGYPIGSYAVYHFLSIPPDKVNECIWVFRFACITCLVGMLCVPFNAMYNAKQYIVELTLYQIMNSFLHVMILFYMLNHPGNWLVKYAFFHCIFTILPYFIIGIRALFLFPECHYNFHYLWNFQQVLMIVKYAGWQFFGCFGALLRGQGIAILVNKCFGPSINASYSIANQLASQTQTLSASLSSAFAPAITTACGGGDYDRMQHLAYTTCKIGTLLIMFLALPLMLELNNVLVIWLKEPPEYVASLCMAIMIMLILDRISYGHMLAVNSVGKIARYQAFLGTCLILTLPLAWILIRLKFGVYSIGYAMIITMSICSFGRVWFARKLAGMSLHYWLKHVLCPLFAVSALSILFGCLPHIWLPETFLRIVVTTLVVNSMLSLGAWKILLMPDEKKWVTAKITGLLKRIH